RPTSFSSSGLPRPARLLSAGRPLSPTRCTPRRIPLRLRLLLRPVTAKVILVRPTSTCLFFFFSSRRRHTRCYRDWSSDVCSSDLGGGRRGSHRPRHLLRPLPFGRAPPTIDQSIRPRPLPVSRAVGPVAVDRWPHPNSSHPRVMAGGIRTRRRHPHFRSVGGRFPPGLCAGVGRLPQPDPPAAGGDW